MRKSTNEELIILMLTQEEIIDIYDKNCNNHLKVFPNGTFKNLENCRILLKHIFKNKNNWDVQYLAQNLSLKKVRELKLTGIYEQLNYSIYNMINLVFPDEIMPWQLKIAPNGFYSKDENITLVLKWFIQKLFDDKIIKCEDDIPLVINEKLFKKYGLSSFLNCCFNSSSINAIEFLYPNMWQPWEFNETPNGYWYIKENRINAMKKLIEERLKLPLHEIPNYMNQKYLINSGFLKFTLVNIRLYKTSNFYRWVDEVYPNTFTKKDFKQISTRDGINVDSFDEKVIHEILVDKYGVTVKYNGRKKSDLTFFNEEFNERYIPDWLVSRGNNVFIIEYFGWYKLKIKRDHIIKYTQKANRKIKFFTEYCEENPQYFFIPLFPDDFKCNQLGIKEKINIMEVDI